MGYKRRDSSRAEALVSYFFLRSMALNGKKIPSMDDTSNPQLSKAQISQSHLCLKLLALRNVLKPFTGFCANRTGVVEHRQFYCFHPVVHCFNRLHVSRLGFVSPRVSQDMGFDGGLIHQCHHYSRVLICGALPGIPQYILQDARLSLWVATSGSFRYPSCPC